MNELKFPIHSLPLVTDVPVRFYEQIAVLSDPNIRLVKAYFDWVGISVNRYRDIEVHVKRPFAGFSLISDHQRSLWVKGATTIGYDLPLSPHG